MKLSTHLSILLSIATSMHIQYLLPYWGHEQLDGQAFIQKACSAGFTGIEINPHANHKAVHGLEHAISLAREIDPAFIVVGQQVLSSALESVSAYIVRMEKRLEELLVLRPNFINSHTGKDYFSFDDNCRVIEAAMNFADKSGIRVLHETHRGRFSFHLFSLLPYLKKYPQLELVADVSHFCVVSESLLEDQEASFEQIVPHVAHLHARVGFSQSPQVNNPMAPEWSGTLERYVGWWQRIVGCKRAQGDSLFTITPEFGPFPYMPQSPFTQEPLADQWNTNLAIKNHLQTAF